MIAFIHHHKLGIMLTRPSNEVHTTINHISKYSHHQPHKPPNSYRKHPSQTSIFTLIQSHQNTTEACNSNMWFLRSMLTRPRRFGFMN